MCANLIFASSAAFLASFGLTKHCGTDSMAVMESISFEQFSAQLVMSNFANCGSNGNSAITAPKSVRLPSSSNAAR
uniref:Putative secreted protein n=1 Tax=Panstrongylus lignarius TaxID=156445 RepID=A0A224Y5S0_9HEMI